MILKPLHVQTTPSRKLPYGRYGSQALESMVNSPGSSLMGGAACSLRGAHSMPLPLPGAPSPQGPRHAPLGQVRNAHLSHVGSWMSVT